MCDQRGSTNWRVEFWPHAPAIVYYCWRLCESRSLIGRRTKRHVLTRALLYGRSCESQHLKSGVSRPLQTHANFCLHEISSFFPPNDCKLAVEYVNIRKRKYARGIILYFKISKHYLVLGFYFILCGGCVEIRLRVLRTGCDFARAVNFDRVYFYLKSNSWSIPTASTVHYDHIKYLWPR